MSDFDFPTEPPEDTDYIAEWDPTTTPPPEMPKVAAPDSDGLRVVKMADLVEPMEARMALAASHPGAGIQLTGLRELDELARVKPGDVIVIGGREGAGKSALALQMARWMSGQGPVLYVLTEMSAEECAERMVASAAHIPLWQIQKSPTAEQRQKAGQALRWLSENADVTLVEAEGMAWPKLQEWIRQWAATQRANGLTPRAVFLDNLWGLAHSGSLQGGSSQVSLALGKLTSEVCALAKPRQADVPIFLVHHLNRTAAGPAGSEAGTESLGGSDHIGYWASHVWLIQATSVQNPGPDVCSHTLKIGKNRGGRNGDVLGLNFIGAEMRFEGGATVKPFTLAPAADRKADGLAAALRKGAITAKAGV